MAYSGQRHAGAAGSSSRQGNGLKGQASSVEFLGRGMVGMQLRDAKPDDADDERDNEPDVVADSGSEAGQIIATTIRGRNGLPKQSVSYIAEHVDGTGSFGLYFRRNVEKQEKSLPSKRFFKISVTKTGNCKLCICLTIRTLLVLSITSSQPLKGMSFILILSLSSFQRQ
uniref:Uncharacterized protein n=1 Tax=Triticum urartu TaxID=4572 RepID=A0A8R7K6Y8_TRIUA